MKADIRVRLLSVTTVPSIRSAYDQAFGDPDWRSGDLEIGETKTLKKGEKFTNSGLDRKGRIFLYPATAKGGETLIEVKSSVTMTSVYVKRDCVNLAGRRVKSLPVVRQECREVHRPDDAVDIDIDIDIVVKATATAVAKAETGAITINVFCPTTSPQYFCQPSGGQTYFIKESSVPLMSLGYTFGGGTKINISNCNSNSNVNSNSNSNANTTVVNTGSGNASGSSDSNANNGP